LRCRTIFWSLPYLGVYCAYERESLAYCYSPTGNSTQNLHVNMCNSSVGLTDWYLTSSFKWDNTRLVSYCLPSQIMCCSFGTNWEGWTGRVSPCTVMSYSHSGLWLLVLFLVQDKEQEVKGAPYQNPSQVFFPNFFFTSRSAWPAGPKITLCFPCLSVYIFVRPHYHVRNNYVMYIVAMRPYCSRLRQGGFV